MIRLKVSWLRVIDEIDDFIELIDCTNDPGCFCIDVRKIRGEPRAQGVVCEARILPQNF